VLSPTLTPLHVDVFLASFCPKGLVGIGVHIGTDVFVRNFVTKTCRAIIDDVEKLDSIQDGFIHHQILRCSQATRLQYINSHILLGNRCVLQHQHVDCKIADAFFESGFGVTLNDVTKDAVFVTTTSRFVTCLGTSQDVDAQQLETVSSHSTAYKAL
jgi:hypothetical protein